MTDPQLWESFRNDNEEAFMALYDRYYGELYAFGCYVYPDREVVRDAIHEQFCELWDNRKRLKPVNQVRSYLFTYLKRKILKDIERIHRHDTGATAENSFNQLYTHSYEEMLIKLQHDAEKQEKLKAVLGKLTKMQLQIVKMKYFDGLSYEEIASLLQIQTRTAYNLSYEAIKTLRLYLKLTVIVFFVSFLCR